MVHRDLTPRNVVLGPDGPCVVDFGIAWYPDAASITQAGSWVGTPAWMPPETVHRRGPSARRGDVWSWGALMVYAALGRPPVVANVTAGPPDRAIAGDTTVVDLDGLPDWLAGTVHAAMALDPADRPTAAAVLAVMLAPGSQGVPPTTGHGHPSDVARRHGGGDPDPAGRTRDAGGCDTPSRRGGRDRRPRRPATDRSDGSGRTARPATAAPWLSGLALVAAGAVVGASAGFLVTVIVVTVLLLVAVALRLARENLPDGSRPVPPTWGFVLAAPVALGVGVAQLIGPLGGVAVVFGLVVLFVLLGGDIG